MAIKIQLIGADYKKVDNNNDDFLSRYKEYKVDKATGERIRYVDIDRSVFQKTKEEKEEVKRRKAICKAMEKRS